MKKVLNFIIAKIIFLLDVCRSKLQNARTKLFINEVEEKGIFSNVDLEYSVGGSKRTLDINTNIVNALGKLNVKKGCSAQTGCFKRIRCK